MKRFSPTRCQARPVLSVIALTWAAAITPDAFAIHCVESLFPVGQPTLIPLIEEIDPRQLESAKEEMTEVLSSKPLIRKANDGLIAIMPGKGKNDLLVVGVESPRPYFRPDVSQVDGFVRYQTSEAENAAVVILPNAMYSPKSRSFFYGKPGKQVRQVFLESSESVAAHAAIDADHQLVVTVRADQKPGFRRQGEDAQRNFLIEVYQLQTEGHAVLAFRVDANEVPYPKVQILADRSGKKFFLQVEGNFFELNLVSPAALGG